jgi:NAD(P)H-hydrate epimerase
MLTRKQSRNADRFAIGNLGIPGIVLMENAGRGCAEVLLNLGFGGGAVIVCGGGNNGGDGFVIARHLHNEGVPVKVILLSDSDGYVGDAKANLKIVERLPIELIRYVEGEPIDQVTFTSVDGGKASWLVDAMLGTGARGDLRPPINQLVPQMNVWPIKRMAVDIPTGMDCDGGTVHPTAFNADVTCTFIDLKKGFENPSAAEYLGHVSVVGIGAPGRMIIEKSSVI